MPFNIDTSASGVGATLKLTNAVNTTLNYILLGVSSQIEINANGFCNIQSQLDTYVNAGGAITATANDVISLNTESDIGFQANLTPTLYLNASGTIEFRNCTGVSLAPNLIAPSTNGMNIKTGNGYVTFYHNTNPTTSPARLVAPATMEFESGDSIFTFFENSPYSSGVTLQSGADSLTLATPWGPKLKFENAGDWVVDGSSGTSGQILTSNGSGTTPRWQTLTGVVTDTSSNVTIGAGSPPISATNGFIYIPLITDTTNAPTGVPTAKSGFVPMVAHYDSNGPTTYRLWIYINGGWRGTTLT